MKDGWKFQYKVGAVLKGAQGKRKFYEGRVRYWAGKKVGVIKEIKAGGIEIDESVAADDKAYVVHGSFGRGGNVTIRDDLVRDLSECQAKIAKHTQNVAVYDGWVEVLEDQPKDGVLELAHSDWLFFFSKKV